MKVVISLTDEEHDLAQRYARAHSVSVGDAIKMALFEQIEDEYDAEVADSAMRDYLASGCKSYPIEEIWERCGL